MKMKRIAIIILALVWISSFIGIAYKKLLKAK